MLYKRILSLFLLICILAGLGSSVYAAPGKDDSEEDAEAAAAMLVYSPQSGFPIRNKQTIAGVSALLCEPESGMILYAQEIDKLIHPLSLAKILTTLVVIENVEDLDAMATVSGNALRDVSSEFSTGELEVGEMISIRDLLYLIMLPSANDACNIVAEYTAGSIDAFIEMLNKRAAEIGCTGSSFVNTHGLPNTNEYSTARDLALITCEALKNETFCEIAYTTAYTLSATNFHEERRIYTTNYMTSQALSNRYYYYRAKGVKYGGITVSYGCSLIVGGSDGNIDLVAIVIGSTSYEITKGDYMLQCFPQAKILLDYGFDYFTSLTVLMPDIAVGELKVNGGTENSVIVVPMESAGVAVPKGYNLGDISIRLDGEVTAPAKVGDPVGTASVYYQEIKIAEVPVTPIREVILADEDHPTQTDRIHQALEEEAVEKTPSPLLVVLILLFVFLLFYFVAYLYHNLTRRRKPVPKKRKKKRTVSDSVRATTMSSKKRNYES